MIGTILASAGIGAGVNVLENLFSPDPADEMQKKIDEVLKQLDTLKISQSEKTAQIDEVADLYTTSMMDTLNDSAVGLGLSGVENPEVIRADMTSKLIGQRSTATVEESRRIDDLNRSIELQKAQIKLSSPVSQKPSLFTSLGTGALKGAAFGVQLYDMEQQAEFNKGLLDILGKETPKAAGTEITNGVAQLIKMNSLKSMDEFDSNILYKPWDYMTTGGNE